MGELCIVNFGTAGQSGRSPIGSESRASACPGDGAVPIEQRALSGHLHPPFAVSARVTQRQPAALLLQGSAARKAEIRTDTRPSSGLALDFAACPRSIGATELTAS